MRSRTVLLAVFGAGLGCAPDSELFDERSDAGSAAGARSTAGIVLFDPPSGSRDLPVNLAALTLHLGPGQTLDATHGVRLRADRGGVVALGAAVAEDCGSMAGSCVRVAIGGELAANATYLLEQALPPGSGAVLIGALSTGRSRDDTPPRSDGVVVEPIVDCYRVRLSSNEPAMAALLFRHADGDVAQSLGLGLGLGQRAWDVPVRVSRFAPGSELEALVILMDRAGHLGESPAGSLRAPALRPTIAITEVLANPAGSEVAQEFVEIMNFGATPVAVGGFVLYDAAAGDVLSALTLDPGGFALLVPGGFNPAGSRDVAPREGTPLLRVDGRLGKDGLGNEGEAVELRGPDGLVISRYGGWVNVTPAAWSGKSVHRGPGPEACDHPGSWSQTPRSATPGW